MRRTHFTDEHEWFRESVAGFVTKDVLPQRDRHRAERQIDRATWRRAGELGFLGLGVPGRYGGADVEDFRFNQVWNEELARAGVAYASSFSIHTDVCLPYLLRLTTDEQRERWLPRFVTGELVTAIGMTEPEAGSDLGALKTRAERDGDTWVINGSKTFITNGASADLVLVAARTGTDPRGKGITLFAVEEGMAGFSRGRKLEKVGQHEADTAELFFEDVRVGDEQVVGEVDRGFAHMMSHLAQERLGSACTNIAHAATALQHTREYVAERRAFGRPVGTFQHNRFLLADLLTRIEVTQAFVDRCVELHVAGELDAVDAAKAKWWSSEVQGDVIDACVQLHGGYGYMEEYEVAHQWMDARVTRIWAGSNEIMKEIIGRSMGFGDPRP
ncbi:MAG TPA: acyl-CoA dehydrogenase family protein [Baekduia sp.]|nr:acyl-CoA dehydrogenase family protein [Baekduia sp.]